MFNDHDQLTITDHESNRVTLNINGDAVRYGAFIEVDGGVGVGGAAAHLTREAMRELGVWLIAKSGQ